MPIKVLVFPCGSEIGLEIHAALKFCKDIELYGVSSVSDHGEYVYKRYQEIPADVDSSNFVAKLNTLVGEWSIDIVLPAHDSVMLKLAQSREDLATTVAVPALDVAEICRNKNLTYARFANFDFIPEGVTEENCSYPIFAKPAVGQGSKGAELVRDSHRHRQLRDLEQEYVFSEWLPGAEYTIDCISDQSGKLLDISPRERMRVKSGISVRTSPVESEPRMQQVADCLACELGFVGAWFFQLKRDQNGILKLLEVAPRIAGSMGLSRNLGVNYPLLTVYAYLERHFEVLRQTHRVQMDRALKSCFETDIIYDRVFIDLDDTLLVQGAVNRTLVALLYQWAEKEIPVTLLTRHAECPRQTLDLHRIDYRLFDNIVHISDGSPKSAVIDPTAKAIFIDDSFRERLDVHTVAGIPVFDVDAVEQLIDWRA